LTNFKILIIYNMDYNIVYRNEEEKLKELLNQIYNQINSQSRECYVEYDSDHYIFFKFIENINE